MLQTEPLQKDLNDATSSAQQQAGQKQQIVMTLTPAEWRVWVQSITVDIAASDLAFILLLC